MLRVILVILLLSLAMSCANQDDSSQRAAVSDSLHQVALASQSSDAKSALMTGEASVAQLAGDNSAQKQTSGRQIIYRASINLEVKSFAEADGKIAALVSDSGGFVSQFNEDRSYGTQRGGRWTIRIPGVTFKWFLDQVGQLGIAQRRDVQSQDVSEEFVDLQARLKNKQALESRLIELVAKRGDQIKDILALEGELSRVREEIERLEGRLRFLSDRVALTTVEITAYEKLDDQPAASTFAAQIASTFAQSLDRLRQLAETVVLILTALAPWAFALGILAMPIGWAARRMSKRGVTHGAPFA